MKTALLCSYGKDDPLLKLATLLREDEWQLLGSAGTAAFLNERKIPCRDVAEIVGPPIFGHRVVTLAREIYAGLLSREEDADELSRMHIARIDLVYVTLYPLEKLNEFEQHLKNDTFGERYLISLAAAAERRVAEYVAASASYWEERIS